MTNPFDNDESPFLVLTNNEGQHSLWPAHIAVPAGWAQAHGPAPREACVAFVDTTWTDMRPVSLREA
ncbi:MbtH family protein [Allokutzneria oryzae]|uniref:MbtH family protein n=1 Tax=Allokutzneria oryzae TaxID=1378989 RepID=A0ABV5ZXF6_9PSEU